MKLKGVFDQLIFISTIINLGSHLGSVIHAFKTF